VYQNYIFDLYGTLIDIHTNENTRSLWEKMAAIYSFYGAEYQPLELKKAYRNLCNQEENKLTDIDIPEIDILTVFQQLFLIKFVEADMELAIHMGKVFRVLSTRYIKLYDGVIELLDNLKRDGKRVYLLSNAQRIFTEPEMKALKIYDYFDGILFSSDYGCKKPSPLFYGEVLEQYHLDKKESIMIGNDPTADILGAYDVGLPSLYIHSNLSPKEDREIPSTYAIWDGDIARIGHHILRHA
jgi:putative hydrolase of the HAD superfamily